MPHELVKTDDSGSEKSTDTDDRAALDLELLTYAYRQLPIALLANALLSLLIAITMLGLIHETILISWLTTLWFIIALRFLDYRRVQQQEEAQNFRRRKVIFLLGLMATGIVWGGSAPTFLFPEDSMVHQVVLAFVLGGMVAGATTSLAALQIPLRIFIGILILPLAGRFFATGDSVCQALGLMLLFYVILCGIMSTYIYKIIYAAFTLKHKNLQEIEIRKKAEANLDDYKKNLERLVVERTYDLARANEELSREIIERKKAEKEKERMADQLLHTKKIEAIGTLAGGIAHDFNNILTIIMGFTELAIGALPPDSNLKKDLREVYKASLRGKNLVDQILEFSRNEPLKAVPVDLQRLLDELSILFRATIPTTVNIITKLDNNCGPIMADPYQIQRLLTNLATNSVQAMEEKGTLTLELKEVRLDNNDLPPETELLPGRYARISVTDTGAGFDPELKKRIFEPFFTTKEVGKGTGMGLAVVHGIVISNHGFIKADSEPGKGTTFDVFFPVTSQKPAATSRSSPRTLRTGREKILLVDDDPAIISVTERFLAQQGYRIDSFTAGSPALASLQADPESFDLVITDQTMPDLSGLELAEKIHQIREDLPVILCTGYSSKVTPENIERARIKTVMMKPVRLPELAQSIRAMLDNQDE